MIITSDENKIPVKAGIITEIERILGMLDVNDNYHDEYLFYFKNNYNQTRYELKLNLGVKRGELSWSVPVNNNDSPSYFKQSMQHKILSTASDLINQFNLRRGVNV